MEDPLVSICCLAYNHGPYIRQCIEGFLMQKTTFPIEILIHDDASTDNTAEIIREYEAKFPIIIKPIYQIENQYSKGVGVSRVFQFPRAKGKYIALCEGDDYWIDPLKLQKQIEFLEMHQEYGLVYTNYRIFFQALQMYKVISSSKCLSGNVQKKLLFNNFIATVTVCFRRNLLCNIRLDEYEKHKCKVVDYLIWLELSKLTKFYYLSDVTSVYRITSNSVTHGKLAKEFEFLNSINRIRAYFAFNNIKRKSFLFKYFLFIIYNQLKYSIIIILRKASIMH